MIRRALTLLFVMATLPVMTWAQRVSVTLTTDNAYANLPAVGRAEANLSALLNEINAAQSEDRDLRTTDIPIDDFAVRSLVMMWASFHFSTSQPNVTDRLWVFRNKTMQAMHIPLTIKTNGEEFGNGTAQEAVVEFDATGRITDFRFALDAQLRESMDKCGSVVSDERRLQILQYVERFRTAYNMKDINFLEQVFSDDALIITGRVVRARPADGHSISPRVEYSRQNKQQYLANLRRAFARNKWIDVRFSEIAELNGIDGCGGITQSSVDPTKYGVRLHQEWRSSTYSDEGYLFLLWDFSNPNEPQITIRTWQPEYLTYKTVNGKRVGVEKLPESELYGLANEGL